LLNSCEVRKGMLTPEDFKNAVEDLRRQLQRKKDADREQWHRYLMICVHGERGKKP